ncbi:MAG TPA: hypothetical protein VMB26_00570 [Candidatus Binataceae bacterium]|nr:hypothetical protein [Candidatus Binataceae bacterium]
MRVQLKSLGIFQTSKVVAAVYFLGAIVFTAIAAAFLILTHRQFQPAPQLLLLPIAGGALGFIYTMIFCWIYNVVAGWIGGIEMELSEGQD